LIEFARVVPGMSWRTDTQTDVLTTILRYPSRWRSKDNQRVTWLDNVKKFEYSKIEP